MMFHFRQNNTDIGRKFKQSHQISPKLLKRTLSYCLIGIRTHANIFINTGTKQMPLPWPK